MVFCPPRTRCGSSTLCASHIRATVEVIAIALGGGGAAQLNARRVPPGICLPKHRGGKDYLDIPSDTSGKHVVAKTNLCSARPVKLDRNKIALNCMVAIHACACATSALMMSDSAVARTQCD